MPLVKHFIFSVIITTESEVVTISKRLIGSVDTTYSNLQCIKEEANMKKCKVCNFYLKSQYHSTSEKYEKTQDKIFHNEALIRLKKGTVCCWWILQILKYFFKPDR